MNNERVVYLAGPIDYAGVDCRDWRHEAKRLLGEMGICTYDPAGPFNPDVAEMAPATLKSINLEVMLQCSGVLAAVQPVPSWGTPVELFLAGIEHMPTVLWKPDREMLVPPYFADRPIKWDLEEACLLMAELLLKRKRGICGSPLRVEDLLAALPEEIVQTPGALEAGPQTQTLGYSVGYSDPDAALYTTTAQAIAEPKLEGDVGYDVTLWNPAIIQPGDFVRLELGSVTRNMPLRLAIPDGYWGTFLPRSSMIAKGFLVMQSVVDSGYRGPLYAFALYVGDEPLELEAGERVAQLVLLPGVTPPLAQLDELPISERGERGFGSTGK